MSTQIILELNRSVVAIANAATPTVFAGIRIPKQNSDILIKNITWGCLIATAIDRTNYTGQYVAILRNTSGIDENSVSSAFAPIFTNGVEVLWAATQNALGAQNHCAFEDGFILHGGNEYMVYACVPNITGSITGTIYIVLSINAESLSNDAKQTNWRMR